MKIFLTDPCDIDLGWWT